MLFCQSPAFYAYRTFKPLGFVDMQKYLHDKSHSRLEKVFLRPTTVANGQTFPSRKEIVVVATIDNALPRSSMVMFLEITLDELRAPANKHRHTSLATTGILKDDTVSH